MRLRYLILFALVIVSFATGCHHNCGYRRPLFKGRPMRASCCESSCCYGALEASPVQVHP